MTTTEIVLCIIILSLSVAYVHMTFRFFKSINMLSVLMKDYILMQSIIKEKTTTNEDAMTVHTENFIKFLSDSREWAFDYIENSIGEIKKILVLIESKPDDSGIIEDIKSRLKTLIDNGRNNDETRD